MASTVGAATEDTVGGFACQVCHRTYDRIDHLERHLDSHRNQRSFRCTECPRGFNRRDLLVRHLATHQAPRTSQRARTGRQTERAIKACDACVKSKVKCGDERPCNRCRKRGIACSSESLREASNGRCFTDKNTILSLAAMPTNHGQSALATELSLSANEPNWHAPELGTGISSVAYSIDQAIDESHTELNEPFPPFFESIMVPSSDRVPPGEAQIPPNMSPFVTDHEEWSLAGDIFGFDFDAAFEELLDLPQSHKAPPVVSKDVDANNDARVPSDGDSSRQRHHFYQKSPWLWNPKSHTHAFSEHNQINVDREHLDTTASPHQPYATTLTIPDQLSSSTRDRLLRLVVTTADTRISVSSFPTTEILDSLIKVGIAKRLETDAWIHPYTFCSNSARQELLIALVAAGSVCFGVPTVNRTGLVLLEIARVALNKLIEDDNSIIRDLQYLQASMLWLDVCAFCGYKRKMEIAESNLQPLVTALRRFGKFDTVAYEAIVPAAEDTPEILDVKWHRWVEQESYKRLVHHLFEHDMMMTMAKYRQPLISYAELSLPLPSSLKLWLSSSAEDWRASYLEAGDIRSELCPSVRSLLADDKWLSCLPKSIDSRLASTAYLYGLSGQVWEIIQQTALAEASTDHDPLHMLWMQSRQQSLYQKLKDPSKISQCAPATASLSQHFEMMVLHVNVDTVVRFAGKCGEREARRAYGELQRWHKEKAARLAIWHASQLLHAVKAVPPFYIRGADAFIAHHAVMVLWSYGMMLHDSARMTGANTPIRSQIRQPPTKQDLSSHVRVFLNDPDDSHTEAFIHKGVGRPALRLEDGQICELRNVAGVMALGSKLLQANCPGESREQLPQMIKGLCNLMDDLGGLR